MSRSDSPTKQRSQCNFWALFTNDVAPHQSLSAQCRHCGLLVNHHKKSEQAQGHLNRCLAFKKYMHRFPPASRPEWFTKRSRASDTDSSPSSPCKQLRLEFRKALTRQELETFQDLFAIHYYVTGTAFYRAGEATLTKALKV